MSSKYRVVSGVLFGVVAIVQIVRAINRWPVQAGDAEIPVAVSWVAALVTASMCAWAFWPKSKEQ